MRNLKIGKDGLNVALLMEAIYKDSVETDSDRFERTLRNLFDEDFKIETIRMINHSNKLIVKLLDNSVVYYEFNTTKITLFLQ